MIVNINVGFETDDSQPVLNIYDILQKEKDELQGSSVRTVSR